MCRSRRCVVLPGGSTVAVPVGGSRCTVTGLARWVRCFVCRHCPAGHRTPRDRLAAQGNETRRCSRSSRSPTRRYQRRSTTSPVRPPCANVPLHLSWVPPIVAQIIGRYPISRLTGRSVHPVLRPAVAACGAAPASCVSTAVCVHASGCRAVVLPYCAHVPAIAGGHTLSSVCGGRPCCAVACRCGHPRRQAAADTVDSVARSHA